MHRHRKFSVLLLESSRLMLFICKWAFGSNTMYKASGGDRIPVESFQILKDDAVKVMHSICQQIWKTQQWPQDWKRSIFIPIPKKGNVKEHSNYHTTALISHVSKVMLKILQARLQHNMNCELPNVQAGFRKKTEEPEVKLPTSVGSSKTQEIFDFVDHNKLWEILQEIGIPDHVTCLLRNLYAGQEVTVRTEHGTTD